MNRYGWNKDNRGSVCVCGCGSVSVGERASKKKVNKMPNINAPAINQNDHSNGEWRMANGKWRMAKEKVTVREQETETDTEA